MQNKVYHAAQKQGLKLLKPRRSTHGKPWVYATKDQVLASCFLGNLGGDFTCAIGRDPKTGKFFLCERFPGAFELRYRALRARFKFYRARVSWKAKQAGRKKWFRRCL